MNKRRELEVSPGLGLDAAGHELHLDAAACLDLGKWYDKHKDDADFTFEVEGANKRFTAHVVAKFRACLTRQVPAIADPCSGAATDTAYSRAFETVDLLLRPGRAPMKQRPYHRLQSPLCDRIRQPCIRRRRGASEDDPGPPARTAASRISQGLPRIRRSRRNRPRAAGDCGGPKDFDISGGSD